MKNFIKDNKTITAVIICVFGFIISWGIWSTRSIFSQDKNQALSAEHNQTITKSVEEVKGNLKEFKGEVKQEFDKVKDKIDGNQEKVINILMRMEGSNKKYMEKSNKIYESMEKK